MKEILRKYVTGNHYRIDDLYIFPYRGKEKVRKKIENAINSFTNLDIDHELYLLGDDTVFGSAEKGFILTADRLYSHDLPKEGIAISDITSLGSRKFSVVDILQNEKKIGFITLLGNKDKEVYELLDMYIKTYNQVQSIEDDEITTEELIEKEIEKTEISTPNPASLDIDDLRENISEEDMSEVKSPVIKTDKKPVFPIIEKTIFLLLTPLYLALIYYKTVVGADIQGLIAVSLAIFILYLPIQIIVAENDLELTFDAIFSNYDIVNYLRIAFGILALFSILLLLYSIPFGKKLLQDITTGFLIVMYGLWWFLTNRILKLANEGSDETQVKIIGWFVFIMALVLASSMSELPNKIGFEYFIALGVMIFQVALVTLILIPSIGIKVFWNILVAIVKSGLKSFIGSQKKRYSTSSEKDLEESLQMPMAVLLFSVMVLVPFVDWVNSVVAGVDPYMTAIGLTVAMILVSAAGAYFQVKVFVTTLVKDVARHKMVTLSVLSVFYAAMVVNMGIVSTIEKSSKNIENAQRSFDVFNNSIQERFKR